MLYEVKTKQGTNFIVDDDKIEIWLDYEESFEETFSEAVAKMNRGSLTTYTKLFFIHAKQNNLTELKTHKTWVKTEFESFDRAEVQESPKAE